MLFSRQGWSLRGTQQSFNPLYEFKVVEGHIAVRTRQADSRWHWINLPGCLEGKVAGISADDDELVIISHDARIFTLDRISDSP